MFIFCFFRGWRKVLGFWAGNSELFVGWMLLFVMVFCRINQMVKFQSDQSSIYPPGNYSNISHLGKRKIIFKMPLKGDMLVPRRVILLESFANKFFFVKNDEGIFDLDHCPRILGPTKHD